MYCGPSRPSIRLVDEMDRRDGDACVVVVMVMDREEGREGSEGAWTTRRRLRAGCEWSNERGASAPALRHHGEREGKRRRRMFVWCNNNCIAT